MRLAFRKVANIISPLSVSASGYQLFHRHPMLSFAFFVLPAQLNVTDIRQ